jgi:SpoVK/Ycf46/Vps4 family AAA+-type ATPase
MKTQKAIDEANGGVLFIDEAYSLGNEEKRDSYAKECIDTINQNLTENRKKFICIIAGYPNELEKCFFSFNPGLKRRFPFKFSIEKYNCEELRDIFLKMLKESKWKLNEEDLNINKLTEFFKNNIDDFPNFGGDIENLLVQCKFMHSRRIAGKHPKYRRKLTETDIFQGLDRFKKYKQNDKNEYMSMFC